MFMCYTRNRCQLHTYILYVIGLEKTKMKFILCVVDDMDKHFEIIIIHKGYFIKLCDNLTYIRGFFLYPSTYSYIKLCGFFRYDFNYIRLIK